MAAADLFENEELFYLKWNNFQTNINNQFEKLRENDDLVDITFACEGKKIGAHKLILFACSPYFKDLLKTNTHSVFFMYGVRYEILKAIIEYMYLGEVHISNENLKDFIQTAESLQIRGLTKDQAIKIPKPVTEISASDLITVNNDGQFDHSLKRVHKRSCEKRLPSNGDGSMENHLYIHNESDDGSRNGDKIDIQMPKPIEKRIQYQDSNQVEPKLEMDDSPEMPNYNIRSIPNPHQLHHQPIHNKPPPQLQHPHPHPSSGNPSSQPPQHIHQQHSPPDQQQNLQTQQLHSAGPQQQPQSQHINVNQNPILHPDTNNYNQPGTSNSQDIKPGYEQIHNSNNNNASNNNNQRQNDEDVKFKSLKRESTPKLTKYQESSRACPVCSRVYSSVSNLRQHMRLIHNPTYVCCPICQKYFNTDLYLRRHISGIHRGENIEWPPPYENNQTTPNPIC